MRYKIVRWYASTSKAPRTIKTGLTLEQAQAHCTNPQTSSRTCTTHRAIRRTREYGPWFDGYIEYEE